jgi:hypothetical protein
MIDAAARNREKLIHSRIDNLSEKICETLSNPVFHAKCGRTNRETVAQIEAAPAAMADVEYPAQLGIQLRLVIEIRILPVDGMADRGFETAFPHGATPYLFVLGLRATV